MFDIQTLRTLMNLGRVHCTTVLTHTLFACYSAESCAESNTTSVGRACASLTLCRRSAMFLLISISLDLMPVPHADFRTVSGVAVLWRFAAGSSVMLASPSPLLYETCSHESQQARILQLFLSQGVSGLYSETPFAAVALRCTPCP